MKTGLILEGGAMRGLFSAGVTDVFMENKIDFDGLIGVSAGAAFGCNYKSNQPGRTIRYNMTYSKDPRYCSFRSLIKTGDLYGADFCYRELPEKLDIFDNETFEKNPMEFHVVCTDVNAGKGVYKKFEVSDKNFYEWIRASASMPLASKIVRVDGYSLLDGGIADSIPLKYFESIGFSKNVVILTQPECYVKKKNPLMPVMKIALRKYPDAVQAMANRHLNYNATLEYLKERENSGDAVIIRPEVPLNIGKIEHDPEKMKRVYEYGRIVGEREIERVKEFLSK
ncbi:MAG: patatin family protein [Firmicutes bacterium]|nr:patatin family protein [Bacillota bacterium]